MPVRVPTLLASEELRAPSFSSGAGPESFGANPGLDDIAQATRHFAGTLSQLAKESAVVDRRRELENDERWVGDAFYQERNHLNEWQANIENNSSEDFAKNFRTYSESRIKEYEGKAPSRRAEQEFRRQMQGFIESRYAGALLTSERTRLENVKDGVINQLSLALETYRGAGEVPNVDPAAELMMAYEDLRNKVEKIYGPVDSALRRKMGAYLDSEVALGIGLTDPDMARKIIMNSRDLEESAKVILMNKVESMERDTMSVGRDNFNRFRADYEVLIRDGKRTDKIPLSDYRKFYDAAMATQLKAQDDQRADIYLGVNAEFNKLAGTNVQNQTSRLSDLRANISGVRDDLTYKMLRAKLEDVQLLQAKDQVAWLMQYNQEVAESVRRAEAAPEGSRDGALRTRSASILRYQGPAPEGAMDPEKYLGLPLMDRRLMTNMEAKRNKDHINQGSPQEVVKRIEGVLASFPGSENQGIAFNDLLRDPDEIRQEYRLVWQNKDQWWVQTFAAALGETKGIQALTDEKRSKFEEALEGSKGWKMFEQAMVGIDPTRAGEIAGFKSGIMTYANYFSVSQGISPEDAVKVSMRHLLDSTMGFTSVGGRPVMIVRDRDKLPSRTDEEVDDIGRRLGVALKDLDPREIDQFRFLSLQQISSKEDDIGRLQALRGKSVV